MDAVESPAQFQQSDQCIRKVAWKLKNGDGGACASIELVSFSFCRTRDERLEAVVALERFRACCWRFERIRG